MGLVDDPTKWILRLFEMEDREGRGQFCQRFPNGACIPNLPLDAGELIFGIYKDKFFFTPLSFIMVASNGTQRVRWRDISSCSSEHGQGAAFATLQLTNGTKVSVPVGEFATGHSGRISQLFHQMIDRWGQRAMMGLPFYSVEHFFTAADSDYCLAPNLEPHPSLSEMQVALKQLADREDVLSVFLRLCELADGIPISDAIIVRTTATADSFIDIVQHLQADGITPADEQDRRKVPDCSDQDNVWVIVWD